MTSSTPVLRTARFVLRPLARGDAPALFPSFADPEVGIEWPEGELIYSERDRDAPRLSEIDPRF